MNPRLVEGDLVIERLKPEHKRLLEAFSCEVEDENRFLREDALPNQALRINETYLLFEKGGLRRITSYITFAIGSFELSRERELYGVKIRDKPYRLPRNLPCMLIGHLATDHGAENRGGATYLLKFALSEALAKSSLVPFPFLVLHSYPAKVPFYEKKGFEKAFTPQRGKPKTICMYTKLFDFPAALRLIA